MITLLKTCSDVHLIVTIVSNEWVCIMSDEMNEAEQQRRLSSLSQFESARITIGERQVPALEGKLLFRGLLEIAGYSPMHSWATIAGINRALY